MRLEIKKGLDIPLQGHPKGRVETLPLSNTVALDLSPFETTSFTLLKKEGDKVKVGEPIAVDKKCSGRVFVSPGSGEIIGISRGLKRRLLSIVIEVDHKQTSFKKGQGTLENLMSGGLYPHIQMRPCLRIAHPNHRPEAIFIKAIESAPFAPSPELEVEGNEEVFAVGLKALSKLCPVHLIYREGSECSSFTQASHAQSHSACGPHPIGNPSVHIQAIHPIKKNSQVVWTLSVSDLIAIGTWISDGIYYAEKVISVAGEGMPEEKRGFYRVNRGVSIQAIIGKIEENARVISGDPLTGEVSSGYLGFYHNVICALPEIEKKREFLHFLKLRRKGYTASNAYFFKGKSPGFTTLQHGEERPFVEGTIYDKVMPLSVETMPLVKTLLTEQYDKGEALGLLEVAPEDFALPAFVCPSKIEMPDIVKQGLQGYAAQHFDD
ncbi:MAG: NADH:ubiquinone reductase (Na(+)-transporting) subunit A [Simkaniaceae bacterium]|nr:MAG: NADH:ubiquinone reductase (Na(+)-transporting) subunit A [Simkaniaceae bacterium]